MKILYLYAEVMGYTMATIEELSARGAELHIVHWDRGKLTPYAAPAMANVTMYSRSDIDTGGMMALAERVAPDITVVSGWQDRDYLAVARKLRDQGRVVVIGFDDQWFGTLRQRVAGVLCRFGYLSRYFTHAWVSGPFQYEYAVRLGFAKNRVVYDLYSADLRRFHASYLESAAQKRARYPHRFLFVGRFNPVKGLDTLLAAWKAIEGERKDWELHLIGNGDLRDQLASVEGIVVKDFMQPDELIREVRDAGCFVLASINEPWGVVVHEFAAAGLPLVLSDVIGAAATFLIPGHNGFAFKVGDAGSLAATLRKVIAASDEQLLEMSEASHQLSKRITPQTSAANLLATAQGD